MSLRLVGGEAAAAAAQGPAADANDVPSERLLGDAEELRADDLPNERLVGDADELRGEVDDLPGGDPDNAQVDKVRNNLYCAYVIMAERYDEVLQLVAAMRVVHQEPADRRDWMPHMAKAQHRRQPSIGLAIDDYEQWRDQAANNRDWHVKHVVSPPSPLPHAHHHPSLLLAPWSNAP